MIDRDKDIVITQYLQSLGIKEMEFFEEMYDHIATSYQNRTDSDQPISDHIDLVITPAFGGRWGIRKLRITQQKTLFKSVSKKALGFFLAFFYKWPYIIATIASVILLMTSLQYEKGNQLYVQVIQVSFLIPLFTMAYSSQRFGSNCRKQGKSYTRSWMNNTIAGVYVSMKLLMYGIEHVTAEFLGYSNTVVMTRDSSLISVLLCTIHILFSLSCLRLYKEDFQTKLQIA